jgi:hypothetical protein
LVPEAISHLLTSRHLDEGEHLVAHEIAQTVHTSVDVLGARTEGTIGVRGVDARSVVLEEHRGPLLGVSEVLEKAIVERPDVIVLKLVLANMKFQR